MTFYIETIFLWFTSFLPKKNYSWNQGNSLSDLMEIIFNCDLSEGKFNNLKMVLCTNYHDRFGKKSSCSQLTFATQFSFGLLVCRVGNASDNNRAADNKILYFLNGLHISNKFQIGLNFYKSYPKSSRPKALVT